MKQAGTPCEWVSTAPSSWIPRREGQLARRLFPYRDLDETAQLTDSDAAELFDFRTGTSVQHGMTAPLRQSVYSRLALPPSVPQWSLTTLRDKLIKIRAKV